MKGFEELQKLSKEQLVELLAESREKARELRFRIRAQEVKAVRGARKLKRKIAQILTILRKPIS